MVLREEIRHMLCAAWKCMSRLKDPRTVNYAQRADFPTYSTVLDLTCAGLGSGVLGLGVFVASGVVAKEVAGPAAILSVLVVAVAAVLSGL